MKQALRRAGDGRCPVWIKRLSPDITLRYGDDLADLFCRWPDDAVRVVPYDMWIGYQPPDRPPRIDPLEIATRDAEWEDEWGTRWAHAHGGVGATPVAHPLKDWSQLDDYLAQQLPDPQAPGRLDAGAAVLQQHGATRYCMGTIHLALFERLHAVRGMMEVFTDLYTHEREIRRLVGAIAGYVMVLIRRLGRVASGRRFSDRRLGQSDRFDDLAGDVAAAVQTALRRHVRRVSSLRYGRDLPQLRQRAGDRRRTDRDRPGRAGPRPTRCDGHGGTGAALRRAGLVLRRPSTYSNCSAAARRSKSATRCAGSSDLLGLRFGGGYLVSPANVLTPEIPLANLEALFQAAHR